MVLRLEFDEPNVLTRRCYVGATPSLGKWGLHLAMLRCPCFGTFCVRSFLADNRDRFPPDKEPWPAYTACESVVAKPLRVLTTLGVYRGLFLACFFLSA